MPVSDDVVKKDSILFANDSLRRVRSIFVGDTHKNMFTIAHGNTEKKFKTSSAAISIISNLIQCVT